MTREDGTPETNECLVAATANHCLECFQQCLDSASKIHPRELSKVEDQFAKFSTWAAGIGVFAPGKASIDHRLRYALEVQSVVIGLLESLSYRIRTCTNILAHYSATNPSSQTERFIRSLGDIAIEISNLNKTSNTVRKAGKEVQILKASDFQIKDDEGNHIEPFLLDLFEHHINDMFPNINKIILKRLARAMLLRRKRILYRRHRQGTDVIKIQKAPTRTQVTLPSVVLKPSREENNTTTERIKVFGNTSSQIKSATTLDPEKFKIAAYSSSFISTSKTVPLSNHETLTFPAAPGFSAKRKYERLKSEELADPLNRTQLKQVESNDNSSLDDILLREIGDIICPYCFYALPAQVVFDQKKWQNHVKNELDPYICLFPDCDQPDVLYSHSEGWMNHLREHCKRWYCSSHRELGAFHTQEEYMKHTREIHNPKLRDAQLRAFARVNTRYPDQIFQTCPLCCMDATNVKGRLEDHIAGHLRHLALKSLPTYPDEISDDGKSENGTSESSRPLSRSTTRDLGTLMHFPGWGKEDFWDESKLQVMEDHSNNFLGKAHVDLDLAGNQTQVSYPTIYELGLLRFPGSDEDDPVINSFLQRKMENLEGRENWDKTQPNPVLNEKLSDFQPCSPESDDIVLSSISREVESSKNTTADRSKSTANTEKHGVRWGNWSDWIWNPEYQRHYRQRQDTNGMLDYDWGPDIEVIDDAASSEALVDTSTKLKGKTVLEDSDCAESAMPHNKTTNRTLDSYEYYDPTYEFELDDEDHALAATIFASSREFHERNNGESSTTPVSSKNDSAEESPPGPNTKPSCDSSFITGTQGIEEQLDPRYRVEPSHKFQPGEIFKLLWSEPVSDPNEQLSMSTDRLEYRDQFGGRIFVGFRRFIVFVNDQNYCTCVPIFSYGGKACTKRGIKPEKHGIIHERNHKAILVSGEPKLGFAPVRCELLPDGETLSRESRVNYSKLITVEHNVKVFFIGRIMAADWEIVSDAVNECWEDKTHHRQKHSR